MAVEQVPLAELVEDLGIYPRGSVSEVHVSDLVLALDAGNALPPPVIDRDTRKLVDGFHRARAYRKRLGEDGVIECDIREFADDAAMLLESARLNSVQGLRLGRYDQRVTVIKARQLGIADDDTAGALGVTPVRLKSITVMTAESETGPVPLKRGVQHLGGRYLTGGQMLEIRRMRGGSARGKATELARLLREDGMVPIESDPPLRQALAELAATIGEVLAPYVVADEAADAG